MTFILFLTFLFCLGGFLIGMVSPSFFSSYWKSEVTRAKTSFFFGSIGIICIVLIVSGANDAHPNLPIVQNAPQVSATPAANPQESNQPVSVGATPITQTVEESVFVTENGNKYHRAGCRYLLKGSRSINLSEAKAKYSRCSQCNPPL